MMRILILLLLSPLALAQSYFPDRHRWQTIAPDQSSFGGNHVCIDRCNALVVVMRWVPDLPEVIEKVLGALEDPPACNNPG